MCMSEPLQYCLHPMNGIELPLDLSLEGRQRIMGLMDNNAIEQSSLGHILKLPLRLCRTCERNVHKGGHAGGEPGR